MAAIVLKAFQKDRASVYGVPVWVILGTWEEYMEWRFKTFQVEIESRLPYQAMAEMVYLKKDGTSISLIWMEEYDHTIDHMGTLAHECIHSAMRILEKVGVPVTLDQHEALTYLFNDIYKSCLDVLLIYKYPERRKGK